MNNVCNEASVEKVGWRRLTRVKLAEQKASLTRPVRLLTLMQEAISASVNPASASSNASSRSDSSSGVLHKLSSFPGRSSMLAAAAAQNADLQYPPMHALQNGKAGGTGCEQCGRQAGCSSSISAGRWHTACDTTLALSSARAVPTNGKYFAQIGRLLNNNSTSTSCVNSDHDTVVLTYIQRDVISEPYILCYLFIVKDLVSC